MCEIVVVFFKCLEYKIECSDLEWFEHQSAVKNLTRVELSRYEDGC